MWDPAQYQRYSDERSRPFFELLARVGAASPRLVVDLGCGPGDLTAALAGRWPDAEVVGVDNSPQMLETARAALAGFHGRGAPDAPTANTGSLTFRRGDVREFAPARAAGRDHLQRGAPVGSRPSGPAAALGRDAAGGGLAGRPGTGKFRPAESSDTSRARRVRPLAGPARGRGRAPSDASPADYLDLLAGAGYEVDAWESTYLHVLQGEDPVLDWYKGSGLRPVIAALPPDEAAEFLRRVRAPPGGRLSGPQLRHRAAVPARLRRRPPGRRARIAVKGITAKISAPGSSAPLFMAGHAAQAVAGSDRDHGDAPRGGASP